MWDCERRRTVRSSIRMCWYHMFSETSVERFVFRVVDSRVFDGYTPEFICDIQNVCEGIVLG